MKTILILGLIFLYSISITFAKQETITLGVNQYQYINPYKIENNTNHKLFIPYTNNNGQILGNLLNNGYVKFPNFGIFGTKLPNNKYYQGGFIISNIKYEWVTGNFGECSSGLKTRSVTCKIKGENQIADDESYCTENKPSITTNIGCSVSASCHNEITCSTRICNPCACGDFFPCFCSGCASFTGRDCSSSLSCSCSNGYRLSGTRCYKN